MAKVWKDHPLFGKRLTFVDGAERFEADVIDVKAGPMMATIDYGATDFPLTGTIKLRIKPIDGRRAPFWTPPMEYKPARHHGANNG